MLNRTIIFIASAFLLTILISACNNGLRPDDSVVNAPNRHVDTTHKPMGIAGLLRFRGRRPRPDSLQDLRVVAFYRKYPLDSIATALVVTMEATFGDSVPRFVDSARYFVSLAVLPPHHYAYIAVGQRWGPGIFTDWRAVGVYAPSGNDSIPGAVDSKKDSVITGIDIIVDYDHLPPP